MVGIKYATDDSKLFAMKGIHGMIRTYCVYLGLLWIKYSTEYMNGLSWPTDTLRVKVGRGNISISEGDG